MPEQYPPPIPPAYVPPSGYGPPPGWTYTPPAAPPSGATARSRRRVFLVGALVVVIAAAASLGIWLGMGGGSTATPAEAKKLETSAIAAAEKQGSFHYVASSVTTGNTQTIVGDAAVNDGRQAITSGGDTFEVRVIGTACYFEGDASAMVENLGVSPAAAAARSGQWVSLASADAPYQSVYAAVTLSSALSDNVTFSPKTELAATNIGGQQVIGIQGPITGVDGVVSKGTAVLYITDDARHLPVRYVETGTIGSGSNKSTLSFRMDFSAWGESVNVSAPSGPVPFASLGGSAGGPIPGSTVVA